MSAIPKVLLVEDSDDDAFFFQRTLKKGAAACEFRHVCDGVAAIRALEESHAAQQLPDIVFLDLKMPVKNGFEVLEWVRQQSFAAAISVVVLSGSDQEADKAKAQALGAAGYLVKPVAADVVKEWVEGDCKA